ncbi:MAG: hypothetical protein WCI97_02640 [Bacteroidota bacterium]
MNYFLFLIPVLNAAFGWWMVESLLLFLFRPYDHVKIAGITIQGILPSLQKEIAVRVGEWAQKNISTEKMESILLSESSLKEMHIYLEEKADDFIRYKLTERISLLKMFITETIIIQAKEVLVEQLDKMIPELIRGFIPKVNERLNIKSEIENRIIDFPVQHFEMEMNKIYGRKIFGLKLLAATIGLLIGILEITLIVF